MNVKKSIFISQNKENQQSGVNKSLLAEKKNKEKKFRKMGEEIRGKMKISTNNLGENKKIHNHSLHFINQEHKAKPLPQEYNKQKALHQSRKTCESQKTSLAMKPLTNRERRVNSFKSSGVRELSSTRSNKSVKFNPKITTEDFSRKHSASSILKNGSTQNGLKRSTISESMKSSMCSTIMRDQQSSQNPMGNKILKQKYQRELSILQSLNKKYNDELYPPIRTSLCYNNNFSGEIKWVRVSELVGENGVVWNSSNKCKIMPSVYGERSVFPTCFNTIKHNNFILEKMFQNQQYNKHGIYYIKINHSGVWKYTIVDDYVPVIKGKTAYEGLFVRVQPNQHRQVEIWPYLLLKAYAKYYSTYQSLLMANHVDFIEELTGCSSTKLPVSVENAALISQQLSSYDTIAMIVDKQHQYYPVVPQQQSIQTSSSKLPIHVSKYGEYQSLYLLHPHKYLYTGVCSIKQQAQSILVRSIRIDQVSNCSFSVVQKDIKHYRGQYRYMWVRMIIVMKEGDHSYEWIDAVYGKSKSIKVDCRLDAGDYYVLLIPEWTTQPKDFHLVFSGNHMCKFQHPPKHVCGEEMLVESCLDVGQRLGRLQQLNKNICTYTYIHKELGLIIENINNERSQGDVRIYRSIENLVRNYPIKAFNKELASQLELEIKIPPLQHYTVVLGLVGGCERSFLDSFCFGT